MHQADECECPQGRRGCQTLDSSPLQRFYAPRRGVPPALQNLAGTSPPCSSTKIRLSSEIAALFPRGQPARPNDCFDVGHLLDFIMSCRDCWPMRRAPVSLCSRVRRCIAPRAKLPPAACMGRRVFQRNGCFRVKAAPAHSTIQRTLSALVFSSFIGFAVRIPRK